jgi:exodeoxyribonuclease V alpha subunit
VSAFAEGVFDIIEQEPDRLTTVPGIGPVRAKRITGSWADQKVIREIMVFLQSHGVSTSGAVRIFKTTVAMPSPSCRKIPIASPATFAALAF